MISSETLIVFNFTGVIPATTDCSDVERYKQYVLVGQDLEAMDRLAIRLENEGKEVLITETLEDISEKNSFWKSLVSSSDVSVCVI